MPQRIQRRRTRGWKMPEGVVYVGRPTKWGNPWTVAWSKEQGLIRDGFHEYACFENFKAWLTWTDEHREKYPKTCEIWLYEERRAELLKHLHELRGKDLACYCGPEDSCHADVLLEIANR